MSKSSGVQGWSLRISALPRAAGPVDRKMALGAAGLLGLAAGAIAVARTQRAQRVTSRLLRSVHPANVCAALAALKPNLRLSLPSLKLPILRLRRKAGGAHGAAGAAGEDQAEEEAQYTPTEALPAAGEQVAVTEEATQADDKPLLPGLEEDDGAGASPGSPGTPGETHETSGYLVLVPDASGEALLVDSQEPVSTNPHEPASPAQEPTQDAQPVVADAVEEEAVAPKPEEAQEQAEGAGDAAATAAGVVPAAMVPATEEPGEEAVTAKPAAPAQAEEIEALPLAGGKEASLKRTVSLAGSEASAPPTPARLRDAAASKAPAAAAAAVAGKKKNKQKRGPISGPIAKLVKEVKRAGSKRLRLL